MDLELTKDQEMIKETARELAKKEITPIAAEIDKTGRFPKEVMKKMADTGFFGILIPPPFGGAGGTRLELLLITQELARASAAVALSFTVSVGVGFLILAFGNDEQKRKYLPSLANGKSLGAFAITEPSGGTNWPLTLQTRAVSDDGQYLVNGSKCFVTNGGEAGIYIVLARTDPIKGPMGISAFIIEKDRPGFSLGTKEDKFGLRADPTMELVFQDCSVSRENLLGEEGDAMKIAQVFGGLHFLGQAAISTGIAQAALESTIKYTKERTVVEPNSLANFEAVQSTITDMAAAVEAARLLAHRAALVQPGKGPDPAMFFGGIVGPELALDVTGKAIKLHGGYGCTRDFPVERYFRDAKTLSLHPSSDFIRINVGKMLLGIPLAALPKAGGPPK